MTTNASPQTSPPPSSAAQVCPRSWLDASIAVLTLTGRPMRPPEIVAAARQRGWVPPSATRTPTQSVARDLRAAARNPNSGLAGGPGKGQFHSLRAHAGDRTSNKTLWLPSAPLLRVLEASGGLAASGLRCHADDTVEHRRLVERLQRSYERARNQGGWVTVVAADELCVRVLGVHPVQVFGPLWWDPTEDRGSHPPVPLPRAG